MLFTSLVFLRTVSQDPSGLNALLIDLLIPREVIRDVNTKIFLGSDYRAGHMMQGVRTPPEMTSGFLINTVQSA